MSEVSPLKISSFFEGYDFSCNEFSTLSFVLPEGPNFDIEKIDFEYTFQAAPGFAPVTQGSQLYFQNLSLFTPIYNGTIEDSGQSEFYQIKDYTGFNDSFCGGDTLTFQLLLWRDDGFEGCSDDQFVIENTFKITVYYSDVYADKVIVGSANKNVTLEVNGNLKLGNIPGIDQEGTMVYDDQANDFLGFANGTWKSLIMSSELKDQDTDTRISVEETPDDDMINFIMSDTSYFTFDRGRINVHNNNNSVFLGNSAGLSETTGVLGNVAIGDSSLMDNADKGGNVALGFKALMVNGSSPVFASDGTDNTAVGFESMRNNNQGTKNVAVGYNSLSSNTSGNFNTALGANSLADNTNGYSNIGIGFSSLSKNQGGYRNIALGRGSNGENIGGNSNIAMGVFSLSKNTSGSENVAIGEFALEKSTVQSENIAIGYGALQNNGSGSTDPSLSVRNTAIGFESQNIATVGNDNTSVGYNTLKSNTAYQNTAVGASALENNLGGFDNTAIGFEAMNSNAGGTKNTALGSKALMNSISSNNTAIGSESMKTHTSGSNNTAVGNRSMADGNNAQYVTAIGANSLTSNTGNYNTAVGYGTMLINTDGFENTAVGANAISGNTTGDRNVALGFEALFSNSSTSELTALGYHALRDNTDGIGNTGVGFASLRDNTTGNYNTALGHASLIANTGSNNTASGYQALSSNTSGHDNSAIGYFSLKNNDLGWGNVSIGSLAMEDNTDGFNNVAIGETAMYNLTSGEGNIAIGANAFSTAGAFDICTSIGYNAGGGHGNSTALGYATILSASDQIRLGNSLVTSIGGYAAWTNVSDGRFKKNVREDVPGLEFIKKLNPVTYNYDHNAIRQYHNSKGWNYPDDKFNLNENTGTLSGFIAQEVKEAAEELNYDFSGVDQPKNENDFYGLRYASFVVPIVKSIQEMDEKIENQAELIDLLKKQNELLIEKINLLEASIENK